MHLRIGTLCSFWVSLIAALTFGAAGAASAQFSISRFTIDGGGGTNATGGTFGLGGTIGQPDAGRLSGSSFTLSGGFWLGGGAVSGVGNTPGNGVGPTGAPIAFRVYPASHNPAFRQTVIAFDLPEASVVRATLFDTSGRLVRILADELLPAGKHNRTWDRRDGAGRTVVSGIYFLRLEAGANSSRQKLVVFS